MCCPPATPTAAALAWLPPPLLRLSVVFSGQRMDGRGWFLVNQPRVCFLKEPFVHMLEGTDF